MTRQLTCHVSRALSCACVHNNAAAEVTASGSVGAALFPHTHIRVSSSCRAAAVSLLAAARSFAALLSVACSVPGQKHCQRIALRSCPQALCATLSQQATYTGPTSNYWAHSGPASNASSTHTQICGRMCFKHTHLDEVNSVDQLLQPRRLLRLQLPRLGHLPLVKGDLGLKLTVVGDLAWRQSAARGQHQHKGAVSRCLP